MVVTITDRTQLSGCPIERGIQAGVLFIRKGRLVLDLLDRPIS